MPDEVDIEFTGITETEIALRGVRERADRGMRRIAEGAARTGADVMRTRIPRKTGESAARVNWSDPEWHPGGAGGGGYWEAQFGVLATPGHDHIKNVVEGTGIFGRHHEVIRPTMGHVLVFEWHGRKVFTPYVKGQAPNDRWVVEARDAADAFVALHTAYVYEEIASHL